MRSNQSYKYGRGVLYTLIFIHFVLPFTPINQHPELRILIGSLFLGIVFSGLLLWSYKSPLRAFSAALGLLLTVYVVSASTGASPIEEGWIVKLVFVMGLAWSARGALFEVPT